MHGKTLGTYPWDEDGLGGGLKTSDHRIRLSCGCAVPEGFG